MLPALSDKYSARESAISLPREPGGLIKQMRSTKKSCNGGQLMNFKKLTLWLLKLVNEVFDGIGGPLGDQRLH